LGGMGHRDEKRMDLMSSVQVERLDHLGIVAICQVIGAAA